MGSIPADSTIGKQYRIGHPGTQRLSVTMGDIGTVIVYCGVEKWHLASLISWRSWVRVPPHATKYGLLAQLVRASACRAEGHGFEFHTDRHYIGE